MGKKGEALAAKYLEEKGYQIIDKNFRCRLGEIDLIAVEGDFLVFIEVKLRSSLGFGHPLESITKKKQDKIRQVAQYFLLQNKKHCNVRIDVISILINKLDKPQITHLENVF